uniref:Uncharacterized protein n=1 Tax=Rhipicephalus microplus TaxID=6941 RepID=A0A6G5AGZ7_RHIMP
MEAELTNKEVSLLVVNEREDNLVVADSEESPSLLQQDKVTRLASPREIWDIDEDAPSNALSTVTPAREMPCRRLQSVADDGNRSPSLLDAFAKPRSVSDPCTSDAVKEMYPSCPPASDVIIRDNDLPRKQVQRDNGKLSLLRKHCASPAEPAEVFMVQPTSRAKRKKQTKLSDRYFISVNRSMVPATRSSSTSRKRNCLRLVWMTRCCQRRVSALTWTRHLLNLNFCETSRCQLWPTLCTLQVLCKMVTLPLKSKRFGQG